MDRIFIRPAPRHRPNGPGFVYRPPSYRWAITVYSLAAGVGLATAAILWAAGAFNVPKPVSPRAQRSAFENQAADGASLAWKRMSPEEREARRRAKRLVFPQASRADIDAEIEADLRLEAKRRLGTKSVFDSLERMSKNQWPDKKPNR